jgi:hypothetical protein
MVAHEVGQRARKIFHSKSPSPAIAPFLAFEPFYRFVA